MHTHTEQSLAHLTAHDADMLQQGLQGLQGTVSVVVTPGAGCTLARSCSNTSARIGRGGLRSHLVQELLGVEAEGLTWWSVRRSAAQRLTALCIDRAPQCSSCQSGCQRGTAPCSLESQTAENGQHMNRLLQHRILPQ